MATDFGAAVGTFAGVPIRASQYLPHPSWVVQVHFPESITVSIPPGPDRSDRWAVFVWEQRFLGRQALLREVDRTYRRLGLRR